MLKNKTLILLVIVLMLTSVFSSTAFAAGGDLVKFNMINESNQPVYLYLTGDAGQFYYFYGLAGETKTYTPERGEYSYTMTTCGATTSGTIDMTKYKTDFVVPVCGDKYSEYGNGNYTFNTADAVKLVAATLVNDSSDDFIAILTGPSNYVFSLDPGKTKDITVPRGTYAYTLYICGGAKRGNVYVDWDSELSFTCSGINK